jgi:hypothetical protein
MVCIQVIGEDNAVAFVGSQGNFELNAMRPIGGNAWSMRSTSGDGLDLTRCEDRGVIVKCRRLGIQTAPPCH